MSSIWHSDQDRYRYLEKRNVAPEWLKLPAYLYVCTVICSRGRLFPAPMGSCTTDIIYRYDISPWILCLTSRGLLKGRCTPVWSETYENHHLLTNKWSAIIDPWNNNLSHRLSLTSKHPIITTINSTDCQVLDANTALNGEVLITFLVLAEMDELYCWTRKHWDSWGPTEVVSWVTHLANKDPYIDFSKLHLERFYHLTGPNLQKLSQSQLMEVEPTYGKHIHSAFEELMTNSECWGFFSIV